MPLTISAESAFVVTLALLFYTWTVVNTAMARAKSGIKAPAVTGDIGLEIANRIQINTVEQMVIFLPALFLFDHFVNPWVAAALGLVWVIGRILYAYAYMRSPDKRGPGFGLTFLPSLVLLIGAIIGTARALFITVQLQ